MKKRVLTVLLAAAVLLAVLSSACYIAIEAGHDCVGEDCPICYRISVCENTLKTIGQAVLIVIISAFFGIFIISLPFFTKKTAFNTSLVVLKVKLSD